VRTNPTPGCDEREFRADWFTVDVSPDDGPIHALILDDTWTTGSRAQSLAYALKEAGAANVTTVVLGRHIDPDYPRSRRLLEAIDDQTFDTARCCVEDSPA
jgi:hypothetical protein